MKYTHAFEKLSPDLILSAVEEAGLTPTGVFTQLNSYENRVFSIELEEPIKQVIAKFYRPQRWSQEAITEEHLFLQELFDEGIAVPPALTLPNGNTCMDIEGMTFSLFTKIYGRLPQELIGQDYQSVGALLARVHNIGARQEATHRPFLTAQDYGWPALEVLQNWIDPSMVHRYCEASEQILDFLEESIDPSEFIRIHGDAHRGNLLHSPNGFFFVDFDDFCNGPEAQDLWMLFGGIENISEEDKNLFLEGYSTLRTLPHLEQQETLMEPLRGLRIIHYSSWIAKRWEDPSFPKIFPQFQDYAHWAQETEALEKIAWKIS